MSKTQSTLGVTLDDKGAAFRVWAPFASSVAVIGSFNEWSKTAHPLQRDDSGCWQGYVEGAKVGQEYKFFIKNGDTELERNDPLARQLTASMDASVIVDPVFKWNDDGFSLPPPNQQVMYELHLGTFHRTDPATPGTFESALAKLDHLVDLGVNVIELMPVNGTSVDRWWGYDPDYFYAVDAAYGGRRAFQEFVQAAHQRGLGVILDVVYNHMSPYPGLDLWQFDGWTENGQGGIYFYNDWRGETPWGPRPDYGRPEVREYIAGNVKMWMRDCHVDGVRVDAAFQIRNAVGHNNDPSTDLPDGWRVLQEITAAVHEIKPKPGLAVAEDMAINEYITKPASEGGAGFDAQWETSFPSMLRKALNPLSDSDRNLQSVCDALTKRYNGDAFQRVVYSESHDADANGNARLNTEISPEDAASLFARRRSTLGAVIVMTAPGIPMLFQGQEFMEGGWFNHWQALDWERAHTYQGIVKLYCDLGSLRHNRDGFTAGLQGQGINILQYEDGQKVIAYHRWDRGGAGDDVVVVVNISNQNLLDYKFGFPSDGHWKVRFSSDWQGYSPDFTNVATPDIKVNNQTGAANLAPYSALILSQDK